jgi:uncharacterized protein
MRNLLAVSLAAGALSFALGGTAMAAADPTVHQIYEAASSGHPEQAQQMMDEVLRDHPNSAKAHYVQSELYAREGKLTLARTELDRAEQLEPGLPRENPRSVAALKSQLGLIRRADPPIGATKESAPHFPWVTVLILALVGGVFWMLFRRRTTSMQYPPGGMSTTTPGAGAGYGPGGSVGGGIGSTVAGGLAGGLAAGAGIVAGEALAHEFLEGGHSSASRAPPADDSGSNAVNSDMGGTDFGVNDPGSWDDGSSGGGDDWT